MKNILRPSKAKIIIHLLLSLCYVLAIIFLPVSEFGRVFSEFDFSKKLLSFFLSWLVSFIVYYPLTFSVAYLVSSIKNSLYPAKEIISSLILVIIFNPLTLAFVFSHIIFQKMETPANSNIQNNQASDIAKNNAQPDLACGLRINDFTAGSKANEAGIEKGDIIMKFNGVEIKSVQDIFDQLAKKKPGDRVSLETDKGLVEVELTKNPNNPDISALGVKLEPNPCSK